MASLKKTGSTKPPSWMLQWWDNAERKRHTVRLGKVDTKTAETIRVAVSELIACKKHARPAHPDTLARLDALPDEMHTRLARAGLVEPRARQVHSMKLKTFFAIVLWRVRKRRITRKGRTKPPSRRTLQLLRQSLRMAIEFFGDIPIMAIGPDDARRWHEHLSERGKKGKAYSDGTVAMHCRHLKKAINTGFKELGIRKDNPVSAAGISCDSPECVKDYISVETALKLLGELPSGPHRLVFALARFGGLRVPSETHELQWADVDWERSRLTVRRPKTGTTSVIPIDRRLMLYIQAAFDETPDGETRVVQMSRNNLHRTMEQAQVRLGMTSWKKPFHALRASRETDWHREGYSIKAVCEWLGHGPEVALKHYLQVVDADYERASGSAAKSGAINDGQHVAGNEPESSNDQKHLELQGNSHECNSLQLAGSTYESPALTAELQGRWAGNALCNAPGPLSRAEHHRPRQGRQTPDTARILRRTSGGSSRAWYPNVGPEGYTAVCGAHSVPRGLSVRERGSGS